jgi:hypothetical protein
MPTDVQPTTLYWKKDMEPDVDGSGPLLRGLCRLAHHIGEAEFTAIYVKKETGGVRVLASAGMALGPFSEKWWVPVNPDNQPVVSVPDITREPLFADHPVHSLPGLKSVMMFPFRAPAPAGFGGLGWRICAREVSEISGSRARCPRSRGFQPSCCSPTRERLQPITQKAMYALVSRKQVKSADIVEN